MPLILQGITTPHQQENKIGWKMNLMNWKKQFSELKEHVLTQCKEAENIEKRLEKMLTRITSSEKNINDLMELKNTA